VELPERRGARLVVVGASAGGVEALRAFVGALPDDLPCAVLVVLHLAPAGPSFLPDILQRETRLAVRSPADGDVLRGGEVLTAPPDRHLVALEGRARLLQSPRENGVRPAVDPALRSAAAGYGPGAAGVVLSGTRDDGTAGLLAVKRAGGLALAQDPAEAAYPSMPRSAAQHVPLDLVAPAAELAAAVARQAVPLEGPTRPSTEDDVLPPNAGRPARDAAGEGTRFICPDCGGSLFEVADGTLPRFQCSVGHAFSLESLAEAQGAALEHALWAAVRTLEDRVSMLERLAERAERGDQARVAASFTDQAREVFERAVTIREVIEHLGGGPAPREAA
jgi:two-component system, chemotaxis family, protein-glutamate methylesterase/glutaminase